MNLKLLFLLLAMMIFLAGCSQRSEQVSLTPTHSPSSVEGANATLSFPSHIKHLTNVPFTLKLTDRKTGKPITDMRATLGLDMPSMTMPINVVKLSSSQPGVYTGTGIFTMPGSWQATAVYLDSSGNEGSKILPVQVK